MTTNVNHRTLETRRRQLERIINAPQRRNERITNSREPSTRSGIGFKHDEASAFLEPESGRRAVVVDFALHLVVREVSAEFALGRTDGTSTENSFTIVGGVPFNGEVRDARDVCIEETSVPNTLWSPLSIFPLLASEWVVRSGLTYLEMLGPISRFLIGISGSSAIRLIKSPNSPK